MSANYSVPGRDSNVELMALDIKPNDQKIPLTVLVPIKFMLYI